MPFNKDRFKEGLRSKIDSLDKWNELLVASGGRANLRIVNVPPTPHLGHRDMGNIGYAPDSRVDQTWWLERELSRMQYEVYPITTDILSQLVASFHLTQYCIHISADDPTMLAYTPSVEDGLRDKQVRLSFGKLMRKLLLLVTDTHIQQLEAMHRSELDPTFSIARTPDEIFRVYTRMVGDTGCMRYGSDHFDLPNGLHPSHVYEAPGMGVAYHEISGQVKSRSVIWENPADPSDKRYVRVYGDSALKRKLERAGYRCRDLSGAKLKAIRLDTLPRYGKRWSAFTYVMPYLDGPAGDQSGHYDGSYGFVAKGDEGHIRLVTREQSNRLSNMGYVQQRLKGQGGHIHIPTVDLDTLMFTCALSGRQINGLEEPASKAWIDGEIVSVSESAAQEASMQPVRNVNENGETFQVVYIKPPKGKSWTELCFEDYNKWGGWFLDTAHNRKACGYAKLWPEKYGEKKYALLGEVVDIGDDRNVYRRDAHIVFEADGTQTWRLTAELDALKKSRKYVATAPLGEQKILSHVDNPKMVLTIGGRKVIRDLHSLRQYCDDTWDFAVNPAARVDIFGHRFLRPGSQDVMATRATEGALRRAFADDFIEGTESGWATPAARKRQLEEHFREYMRYGFQGQCFYLMGEAVMRGHGTLASMRKAAEKLRAMTDEQIGEMIYPEMIPYARGFEHHALLLAKIFDEAVAKWNGTAAPAPTQDLRVVAEHEALAA